MEVSFSIDNLSFGIEDIFNCFRTIFEKEKPQNLK